MTKSTASYWNPLSSENKFYWHPVKGLEGIAEEAAPITKLIRSKRKSISLQLKDDGVLVVRAPFFLNDKEIQKFISQKKDWIDKVYQRVRQRLEKLSPKQFVEGETFLYLGRDYPLHIAEDIYGKLLFEDRFILSSRYAPKARKLFERWYREEAFSVFTKRCLFFSGVLGVRYKVIKLSSAKRRWGSCHPKGTLCFNWRLILAPQEILDYVVVHELAHIKEPNHSKAFWTVVENASPGYRDAKKWLAENQWRLFF